VNPTTDRLSEAVPWEPSLGRFYFSSIYEPFRFFRSAAFLLLTFAAALDA